MAVELVKQGAADYMAKPWDDHKLLTSIYHLISSNQTTKRDHKSSASQEQNRQIPQVDLCGLVFSSGAMHRCVIRIHLQA